MKRWLCLGVVLMSLLSAVYANESILNPVTAVGFTVDKDFNNNRPLLLASSQDGNSWYKPLASVANLPASGIFEKVSCTGQRTDALCIAVGSQDEHKQIPLVAVKASGQEEWLVKYLKSHGSFFGASCTGQGHGSVCAIGFQDFASSPFVVMSQDGGYHWYKRSIDVGDLAVNTEMTAISCTGQDTQLMCTAIGAETIFEDRVFVGFKPIIAVSKHNQWHTRTLPLEKDNLMLKDVSCIGKGRLATCVAIGFADLDTPAVIVTQDGGDTWTRRPLPDLPPNSDLKRVSCTEQSGSVMCAVVGSVLHDPMRGSSSLILVSTDGGYSWESKGIHAESSQQDVSQELLSVHCSAHSSHLNMCIAAGFKEVPDLNAEPESSGMIVISTDNGHSWEMKEVPELESTSSFFRRAYCEFVQDKPLCFAAGGSDGKPVIVSSTDMGTSWQISKSLYDLQLRNGVLLDIFMGSASS